LGKINDHATAMETFRRWQKEVDEPALKKILVTEIARERHQLEQQCSEFRAWWTPQQAAALAARCQDFLPTPTDQVILEDPQQQVP
jgi:hypothetical protein